MCINSKRLHAQSIASRLLADTDPLTECLNRRVLIVAFETENIQQRGGALFVLNLDNFKTINYGFGHDAGDHGLTHFTDLVHSQLRLFDLLACIGSEVFVVILTDATIKDAQRIAGRTRETKRESEVQFNDARISCTVSIGSFVIPQDTARPLSIWLSVADKFVYRAKQLGRDQYFPVSERWIAVMRSFGNNQIY